MSGKRDIGSTAGSGCLTLFGGVFALAGGAAIYSVLQSNETGAELFVGLGVGALFLAVGLGIILFGRWAMRVHAEEKKLEARYPDEPWRWRTEWANGRIQGGSRSELAFVWMFAVFWNAVSFPVFFFGWDELARKDPMVLALVALFPLVGLGLLWWAVRVALRHLKYGTSELRLRSTPGVVGGRLEGDVYCRVSHIPRTGVRVALTCTRQVPDSDGTSEKLIWEAEKTISAGALGRDSRGMRIPVEFIIPSDRDESKKSIGNESGIEWRLNVHAEAEGIDFAAQFEVPVFRTSESRDDVSEDDHDAGVFGRKGVDFDPSQASFIVRASPLGGTEYYFPPGRNRGAAVGLSIFLIIWLAALAPMLHFGIPWFFIAIWGLFALLMLYIALAMWIEKAWIRVEDGRISVGSSMPLSGGTKALVFSEIDRIQTAIGMSQTGSATQRAKAWHDIEIHPKHGKPLTAAVRLADKQEALWLIGRLKDHLRQ